MRLWVAVLGVALVVVLAGCNSGVAPGADSSSGPSTATTATGTDTPAGTATVPPTVADTVTASPAATHTETREPVPVAGISWSGVREPFAVADAHVSSLSNESFLVERHVEQTYLNGTVRLDYESRVEVGPSHDRYYFLERANGTKPIVTGATSDRLERYANGTHVFESVGGPPDPSRRLLRFSTGEPVGPQNVHHGTPLFWQRTGTFLARMENERVETYAYTGEPSYRVSASSLRGSRLQAPGGPVELVSVEEAFVVVTEDGRVAEFGVEYEGIVDGERVRGVEHVLYRHVGSEVPDRPDWVDDV